MELSFTPEQERFAAEVREFLRENPPESFPVDAMDAGYGAGSPSVRFAQKLAERGWITMTWPEKHGGQGKPLIFSLILLEEMAKAGAHFEQLVSCDQTARAIMRSGTPHLIGELLPKIARGEVVFWQGFSEPESGTDLLSLTTRAVASGDGYEINGQKAWSSHAGVSTHGLIVARTATTGPKHHGLSFFIVDNRTPGITITPVQGITGEVYHYQVFLDQVRASKDCLLGKENEGFEQLLVGLNTDRFWARFYKSPFLLRMLKDLVSYANATVRDGSRLSANAHVRRKLAMFSADLEALRLLFYRTGWLIQEGRPITYEAALGKVMADETGQRLSTFALELIGPDAALKANEDHGSLAFRVQQLCLTSLGHTIAGGTAEVIRNTIATRGLGLPSESSRKS